MKPTKTKLQIFIERSGASTDRIVELIGRHNEGINLFLIKEVYAIVREQQNRLPSSLKDLRVEFIEDEGRINVYENGKDLTYTIEENIYYELSDVDMDDMEKQIAHPDALFYPDNHSKE